MTTWRTPSRCHRRPAPRAGSADTAGRRTRRRPNRQGTPEELAALADLAAREGVDPATITVVSTDEVTWRDGSLGCPEPGMNYTQALVPGVRVVLELDGVRYEYHAGGRRLDLPVREPAASRRGLTRAVTLVAVATAAACSGDGATPATSTVLADGRRRDLPPVVATTPQSRPPLAVVSGPTFRPGAVVAPSGGRPWLLVGTGRAGGRRPEPADDLRLARRRDVGAHSPSTRRRTRRPWPRTDGPTAPSSSPAPSTGDDGSHPAIWELRDGALVRTGGPRGRPRRGDSRRPRCGRGSLCCC